MKIQHRTIYLLATIFLVYTLLISGFIYYSIAKYSFTDFYKRLEIRAAITAKIRLEKSADIGAIKEMHQEYLEILPNQQEHVIWIDTLSKNRSTVLPLHFIESVIETGTGSFSKNNIFYSGIRYKDQLGRTYFVAVSAENYFYSHHIAYLRNLIITVLVFALFLIILISYLISRSLITPIQNIINEAQKISSENLHLRLKTPVTNDSLSKLTNTFNDMLNRLETSFETQKNFISNASHELNTPLTTIIGEAELALSKERNNEQYKETLAKILFEAEELSKKTKALLLLAQTGFNGKIQKFDKVRIDQLILDVKETMQKINNNAKISFDFSLLPESPEKLKIRGNEQLLHLAFLNIIGNACKYSNCKQVWVALGASEKEVIVVVKDSGIGIPGEELQYIYDPYFRASNTSQYEGYGVGLPLSRNIIKMHNGSMHVSSELDAGTTVEIKLPMGGYTL